VHALSRPLVVGVTGIAGHALAERLAVRGGHLLGPSRRGTSAVREVESLHADLTDPVEEQTAGMTDVWTTIAEREGLRESRLDRVASFWHNDGDLGRDIECLTDMSRSRLAGFTGYVRTLDAFARVFDRLAADRVVPHPG
jgi:nucleoside-diphosphate-sugar epimerase